MKRQTLYELINSHFEKDEKTFLKAAKETYKDLNDLGEKKLASEINKIIRTKSKVQLSSLINQDNDFVFTNEQKKIIKIMKSGFSSGLFNKVFLYGSPGTGKTVFTSILASELNLTFETIRLSQVIDSKLGESMKLLDKVFNKDEKILIFIDEIDSIASQRGFKNDIFEINRILNHLLQLIDSLKQEKLLVVATNMPKQIDPAFSRRFDFSVNFNNYVLEDIINIFDKYSEKYFIYKYYLFYKHLRKLIINTYAFWTPGYIKRIIQISSLWMSENEFPQEQIIEILKLLKLGNTKKEVSENLNISKVPIGTINFFLRVRNEKNN